MRLNFILCFHLNLVLRFMRLRLHGADWGQVWPQQGLRIHSQVSHHNRRFTRDKKERQLQGSCRFRIRLSAGNLVISALDRILSYLEGPKAPSLATRKWSQGQFCACIAATCLGELLRDLQFPGIDVGWWNCAIAIGGLDRPQDL